MTQIFVSLSQAEHVADTAPTIAAASGALGRHSLTVEVFDYGAGMGWTHADLRGRLLLDGVPVVEPMGRPTIFDGGFVIWGRTRPAWLPRGVSIALLNRTARALLRGALQSIS
jgi:hypothetical protein